MLGNPLPSANRLQGMSTIHHRGAAQGTHADPPKDVPNTPGQVAFDVEPATPHEREAKEIHSILQQCQGIIGAHEITSWRSQITVSSSQSPDLLPWMPNLSPGMYGKRTACMACPALMQLCTSAGSMYRAGRNLWCCIFHHHTQAEPDNGRHPRLWHVYCTYRFLHCQTLEPHACKDEVWRAPIHAPGNATPTLGCVLRSQWFDMQA